MRVVAKCTFYCALWLMLAQASLSAASTAPASNFNIVDSLSLLAAQALCTQLSLHHIGSINVQCSEHSARWLVQQNMQRALAKAGLNNDPKAATLTLGIADCSTRYVLMAERDSVVRNVHVEFRASVADRVFDTQQYSYSDVIARADIALLESPKYDFSSSVAPAVPRSTWDDLVEPLIILGALATTVIVLFSVRSQ